MAQQPARWDWKKPGFGLVPRARLSDLDPYLEIQSYLIHQQFTGRSPYQHILAIMPFEMRAETIDTDHHPNGCKSCCAAWATRSSGSCRMLRCSERRSTTGSCDNTRGS